ncbi:hypothetical protein B0H66DRAFT_604252 [Apodospora peruviana]|uniref:F-box domain-containing protein n=1 Tax=Apodospora peruviana TaxID=516989 RepID=A0AAE0M1N0_9PEZI|nr:hypothetical protein B0H66DRAFT_604252 [Apodospora peruviana]
MEQSTTTSHATGAVDTDLDTTNPALDTPESSSPIENLPAEIRSQILASMPDLLTLRSVIYASPTLHAQYRHDRDRILRACLDRDLDGVFFDAYVLTRAYKLARQRTNGLIDHNIPAFLGSYQGWLSGSRPHDLDLPPDTNKLDTDSLRWLASYHLWVIRPLARAYSSWALQSLERAAAKASSSSPAAYHNWLRRRDEDMASGRVSKREDSLSRAEEIRIFRALYRYDTYCQLFAGDVSIKRSPFQINAYFDVFDPWETEAIGCIELFMSCAYQDMLDEASITFNHDFFQIELRDDDMATDGRKYTKILLCSPEFILRRIRAIDHSDPDFYDTIRQDFLLAHTSTFGCPRWTGGTSTTHDHVLLYEKLLRTIDNRRKVAELRRDRMEFGSDAVPPHGPPLAWVLLWDGKYTNIHGEGYVPKSVMRWGYVMWSEQRWADMGAKDLVARQWRKAPEAVLKIMMSCRGWAPLGMV